MKNLLLIVLLLLLPSSISKCNQEDTSQLLGCWTHSYEENTTLEAGELYRKCDYKEFPPSRFRFEMELKPKGKCSYLYLSPTDAHQMVEGRWSYTKDDKLLQIRSLEGAVVITYTILEAKNDRLVFKQL